MFDQAVGGNDTIVGGGAGAKNQLIGEAETIQAGASGGNDTITGGVGAQYNMLIGDAQNLHGKGGNDVLMSAAHTSDDMWGDAINMFSGATGGADTFVFAPGNGADTIHDFTSGTDHIDLTAFSAEGIHSVADLNITDSAAGAVITFDANDTITVQHVHALTSSDFLLA